MHSLKFLVGLGVAQSILAAPAEAGMNGLVARQDDQYSDADWSFAVLDEAYDPDDPAIKDLPEIDPSKIVFTDYDTEVNATLASGPDTRGLVSLPFNPSAQGA
jgi:hypothetical protein